MLKLKQGFVLRKVAGQTVVLASGDELDVGSVITLNETGAFLWQQLAEGSDADRLTAALLTEYEVEESVAKACVEQFVAQLSERGFLAQ